MLLHRILAINIFALAILAGSIFYLDGFRRRLTEQGVTNAQTEVRMAADALALAEPRERQALMSRLGAHSLEDDEAGTGSGRRTAGGASLHGRRPISAPLGRGCPWCGEARNPNWP